MKKLLILAAALLMVGSAFAQQQTFDSGTPTTIANDDSCDIGVTPAATLLLPHFEVDFNAPSTEAVNTVFTITNTSRRPAIAHVVVWTDWSFPVLDFNIFLTGYDVQGINLWDVLSRGVVPGTDITPNTNTLSPKGILSLDNVTGNPGFRTGTGVAAATRCNNLPTAIPPTLLAAVRAGLTGGVYLLGSGAEQVGCSTPVGGAHENAVGYITVDVAATCTTNLPTDPEYFNQDILFDNWLIGDYQRINPDADPVLGNFAGGSPMVHIRALPEGGSFEQGTQIQQTNLPYTFYDRYVGSDVKLDRRQPLPGVWAARYIEEEEGNDQSFDTRYAIWREGDYNANPDCSNLKSGNGAIPVTALVRFDEHENPFAAALEECLFSPCFGEEELGPQFPETSNFSVGNTTRFPPDPTATEDLGGWMYLNLNHTVTERSLARADEWSDVAQSWVVIQMTAEGRYGVDFDAAWLGNGCSLNPGEVEFTSAGYTEGSAVMGPLPNFED